MWPPFRIRGTYVYPKNFHHKKISLKNELSVRKLPFSRHARERVSKHRSATRTNSMADSEQAHLHRVPQLFSPNRTGAVCDTVLHYLSRSAATDAATPNNALALFTFLLLLWPNLLCKPLLYHHTLVLLLSTREPIDAQS